MIRNARKKVILVNTFLRPESECFDGLLNTAMRQNIILPKLTRPRVGGFTPLIQTQALMRYKPHYMTEIDPTKPKRKSMIAPPDNDTFVKPILQCFVKNPRLMPMSKIMITLLAGWAGQGTAIETTIGIIGKHISRCRRQVFRYLQDAMEEGYLTYSRTKDKIGRYTGIKIYLNFAAIQFSKGRKPKKSPKTAETLDVTQMSETNDKSILDKKKDDELWEKLTGFAMTLGYVDTQPPPI